MFAPSPTVVKATLAFASLGLGVGICRHNLRGICCCRLRGRGRGCGCGRGRGRIPFKMPPASRLTRCAIDRRCFALRPSRGSIAAARLSDGDGDGVCCGLIKFHNTKRFRRRLGLNGCGFCVERRLGRSGCGRLCLCGRLSFNLGGVKVGPCSLCICPGCRLASDFFFESHPNWRRGIGRWQRRYCRG